MNEYLGGLILGLVQGLTEFLPVSSSGHLVLLETLGVGEPDLATNLLLHLATLAAIIVCYRDRLLYLIKHPLDGRVKFILMASVPTGIIAAAVRYFLPQTDEWLPVCFLATSIILLLPKITNPKQRPFEEKLVLKGIIVGISQGIACINGISRSGTTVTALKMCGCSDEDSAETSFLLAVPVILGSSIVEIATSQGENVKIGGGVLLGMTVAFFVGLAALKTFVGLIKKGKTAWFSVYTTVMGIASFFLIRCVR